MNDDRWHIVRDFKRGRLMAVYIICPTCWPTQREVYEAAEVGWKTETSAVTPAYLTADDDCHQCGAVPVAAKTVTT